MIVPEFFYARYGYAVERLTESFLRGQDFAPYRLKFQITHGHTRPDIVVMLGKQEAGWIDLTSEASKGHVLGKQHSGWQTRPYVAEVTYDRPDPVQLTAKASAADPELKARIQRAMEQAENEELALDFVFEQLASKLSKEIGDRPPTSMNKAQELIRKAIGQALEGEVKRGVAKAILLHIDDYTEFEVKDGNGKPRDGKSWASFAFKGVDADWGTAQADLTAFGLLHVVPQAMDEEKKPESGSGDGGGGAEPMEQDEEDK